jgi:hypothetical protein
LLYLIVLEIIDVCDMSSQQNPERAGSLAELEGVLRIEREVVHVLAGADAGMPRLVDGVGVAEQRRVPVHVDDVVKTTQRVVVDLKKAILFKAAKNNL